MHACKQASKQASVGLAPIIHERNRRDSRLSYLKRAVRAYTVLWLFIVLENVEHCWGEPEQAAPCTWIDFNAEMMSWIASVYECRLCTILTWSDLKPAFIILYGQQAACRWWSFRSCCDKEEVRCSACLNLSRLRYSCQRCTVAVGPALPYQVHEDVQFSGNI